MSKVCPNEVSDNLTLPGFILSPIRFLGILNTLAAVDNSVFWSFR